MRCLPIRDDWMPRLGSLPGEIRNVTLAFVLHRILRIRGLVAAMAVSCPTREKLDAFRSGRQFDAA
jgi:hypothetical protein